MKKISLLFVLLISTIISLSSSCNKNDPTVSELSKLPEATQTGANTFGCLVNGQAFLPHTNSNPANYSKQCNYIYTNGGYYFLVDGSDDSNSNYIVDITLSTYQLPISEGQTLKLENRNENGKACGLYSLVTGSIITYQTTIIVNGQLHISKFDQIKQIVSGTFFFNAINLANKDTVHVTDGRFDMKYTQ